MKRNQEKVYGMLYFVYRKANGKRETGKWYQVIGYLVTGRGIIYDCSIHVFTFFREVLTALPLADRPAFADRPAVGRQAGKQAPGCHESQLTIHGSRFLTDSGSHALSMPEIC